MKNIFITILFLVCSSISFSQADSTSVSFVSYWSIGDSYDFKITKINQEWKNDEMVKDQTNSYVANFTVIDSTDTSYTIKWSYENQLQNFSQLPEELVKNFSKNQVTEIIYKTSEVGDFVEVVNWKEISNQMNQMIDEVVDFVTKNDKSLRISVAQTMQTFRKIYSSKEGIEGFILKELQYFHFPMGLEFETTEPFVYEDELPNMLGGNPIKADGKMYFESVDFEEGFCIFKQELNLNEADTKAMLKLVYTQMQMDKAEIDRIMESTKFIINDINHFEYYFYPGIPHKIETSRETIFNLKEIQGKKIEKNIIELIYQE